MTKRRLKPFVLPTLYFTLVVLFVLFTFLINKSLEVADEVSKENYTFVSYEILMDNSIPVISTKDNILIKPYTDETVKIGKDFYNYKDESNNQEQAIVYYGDTYIQNSGIDYVSKDPFNCIAILDGEVISVVEDDIVGKTVKIRHNENLISIYQSLSTVMVQVNDKVDQGQIIGTSGTNSLGSDLGNHLHFELVYKNEVVNPEDFLGKELGDF